MRKQNRLFVKISLLACLALAAIMMFLFSIRVHSTERNLQDSKVNEYIKLFPYQDTYDYLMKYTQGDPSQLNILTPHNSAVLVKAGEDKVVRTNNDTYYSGGWLLLSEGPVKFSAEFNDSGRFCSFQLMSDRNTNFHNVINPAGDYYLYYGEKPKGIGDDRLIESPSEMAMVIIRVEVKDLNDAEDVALAKMVYAGLGIDGPSIDEFPIKDYLGQFSQEVADIAHQRIDKAILEIPFQTLSTPAELLDEETADLYLAARTKSGWGSPVIEHSTYDMIFHDVNDNALAGENGTYTLTMEEPPVDAFWSITVYDTERGGFLHPNEDDKYHINNTTVQKNEDGTITFTFKTNPEEGDVNTLAVPNGQFDITFRYYLPQQALIDGDWTAPRPVLNN